MLPVTKMDGGGRTTGMNSNDKGSTKEPFQFSAFNKNAIVPI